MSRSARSGRRPALALIALLSALPACGGDGQPAAKAAQEQTTSRIETSANTNSGARAGAVSSSERPARRRARRARQEAPVRSRGRARVSVLAGGLQVPWDIAFLPDRRALVTERPGRIRLVDSRGRLRRSSVAQVPTQAAGEGGLLGIAVDPDFARGQQYVYLYVTTASGMQVQRWRWRRGVLRRDGVVLDGIVAGTIHDSGRLRFGPDERLYVATGDAGRGGLAQQRGSLNGKFLRLEPREYRRSTNSPEIFSTGHRNPQGLDWQPRSGRLFATEHGPSGFDGASGDDEVNVVRRGRNYGWPRVRGTSHGGFAAPIRVYGQTIAPSGAAFVSRRGSAWTGNLLVAALKGRALRRIVLRGTRVVREETLLSGSYGRLRAVEEAPDGSIWVTTSNRDSYGSPVSSSDDRILRIVPPAD